MRTNLKMGVVGLPNVGKSSLFNLLTAQAIAAENYPFCTIEPNEARCAVPDERYEYLCSLWNPPSEVPSYLNVTDIAGLIKGASDGAGLGNNFLSHIQATDGIFHVVRVFDDDDVVHVEDSVDPVRDLDTIQGELCKKDLEFLKPAIAAEATRVKKSTSKKPNPLFAPTVAKITEMLENNKPLSQGTWSNSEVELIKENMPFITTKPVIYLLNMSKRDYIRKKNKWLPKIAAWVKESGGGSCIPFSVEFEQELWSLRDDAAARDAFLAESGVQSVLPKIIKTGYKELNLQYFFTAGETEVRCWTMNKGCLAPQAAGVIHTDFETGFIKAEVVAYDDFKSLCGGGKSMAPIKAAGKYRQEGKAYVVQDGDIIHFQFNVTTKKK